jgi:hypothetical protein
MLVVREALERDVVVDGPIVGGSAVVAPGERG